MNKTAAKEWLTIAYHDLTAAQILFEADHFTDSIGNDLQQSLEKILKSILAYQNKKIIKSHDLVEIYYYVNDFIDCESEMELLARATEYLKEDRYPNPNYFLPSKDEIKDVLEFTHKLYNQVCRLLKFDDVLIDVSK
ncbi:MAG: HEPN domain-containing protein [Campylobacterota bacterium]